MIRAIIADDEPAVAEIIEYFIKKNDMPVEIVGEAEDGEEAVELIKKEKPQLVFLDIRMPVMNGFEVMKQTEPGTDFIIITAYESFDYAQQALRLGARDILLKPVKYEQFSDALQRTIGWSFTSSEIVNEILEYINYHYAEKIDLPLLADIVCSTPSQIARQFRKHMDTTVINYLHKIRIQKAVDMLEQGMSVKEACAASGYENLNNFYKYFKQHTGMTPAVYCETLRK